LPKPGTTVYLSALRLNDGELLIVATARPCLDAIETYALRWQIEIDQPYCLHKRVYKNQCISSLA